MMVRTAREPRNASDACHRGLMHKRGLDTHLNLGL